MVNSYGSPNPVLVSDVPMDNVLKLDSMLRRRSWSDNNPIPMLLLLIIKVSSTHFVHEAKNRSFCPWQRHLLGWIP